MKKRRKTNEPPNKPYEPPAVRRRRTVTLLTLILVAVVAAAVGGIWWTTRESMLVWRELDLARGQLDRVALRDEAAFAGFQTAMDSVFHETGYLQRPLDSSMIALLQSGQRFFERFIAFNEHDPRTSAARARAFYLLGRISQQFGRMDKFEIALRKSQQLLQSMKHSELQQPETQIGLAITDNTLACLLVATGRSQQAEELQLRNLQRLEDIVASTPLEGLRRAQLALVLRNLGVITALRGRDGVPHLRRSVEVTSRDVGEIAESVAPLEFLIDSYQIMAELQLRLEDVAGAETTSHQSLTYLQKLRADVDDISSRLGHTPPSQGHRTAEVMARANLEMLRVHPSDSTDRADGWQWRSLHPMPCESLQTDVLVKGTLSAEFERQDGLLLNWLDRPWLTDVLTQIVAATWPRIKIVILVENELLEQAAKRSLRAANIEIDEVKFYHLATDTVWARDWGPLVITAGGVQKWVDPISTANMDFPRFRDDHVPTDLARLVEAPVVHAPIFLHGGGLLSNGAGLCVVAKSQLSWNSTLGVPEAQVTSTLERLTGADRIVYLETLKDEPTEHVDWFASFTAVDDIVLGDYRGTDPVNTAILDRCAAQLEGLPTRAGPLKVHRIPMPARGKDYFGGTYTNVVFANGVLLVPTWPDSPMENVEALNLYRSLLPEWEVIGIDCSALVTREGALHCATRNLFRLPLAPPSP